jgi:hypothetical protein
MERRGAALHPTDRRPRLSIYIERTSLHFIIKCPHSSKSSILLKSGALLCCNSPGIAGPFVSPIASPPSAHESSYLRLCHCGRPSCSDLHHCGKDVRKVLYTRKIFEFMCQHSVRFYAPSISHLYASKFGALCRKSRYFTPCE